MTTTAGTAVEARQRRAMAGLLLAAALLIAAYWLAWLLHRSLVASETGAAYTQFEDAFPLADGWLALCLVAASYCLGRRGGRPCSGSWPGAAPGSTSSPWTCSTTCSTASGARAPTG